MKYSFKSMGMLIKKFPLYLIVQIIITILEVINSILPIYIMSDIIGMYQNGDEFKTILVYILIRFGILIVTNIIMLIANFINMNIQRLFIASTSKEFYQKLAFIDYDFHENPDFLNDYTRALEEGVENIYRVGNGSIQVIKVIIGSAFVFSIIMQLNFYTLFIALGIGIIYLLIRLRLGFINKNMRREQRTYRRMTWYSNRAFTIKDAMADIKISDIDQLLIENNEKSLNNIVKVIDKYAWRDGTWKFIADLLLVLIYPIIVAFLAYMMTDIGSHLAQFASLTVAAANLSNLIRRLATEIGNVEEYLPDCKIPFELMKMEGKIEGAGGEEFKEDFCDLEVKDLTFSYTGKKNQLENINMFIKKGEHIAIVGSNGAGKTTLVKLLLRLYDPNNGTIKINGKDYKDLNVKDLRIILGAVFQNVETYAVSIAENILLRKPETEEDYKLIDDSLKFSGLYDYVYSLKDGINTEISREFRKEGTIFSGGQNQRLAIARGYAQNYQVFILDEPSSALDPLAEAQVYKNMLELGKDKTLIFISHRLTTTVNADKIFLFENGRIKECGTHDELMAQKGTYYVMFNSQSNKYTGGDYE